MVSFPGAYEFIAARFPGRAHPNTVTVDPAEGAGLLGQVARKVAARFRVASNILSANVINCESITGSLWIEFVRIAPWTAHLTGVLRRAVS